MQFQIARLQEIVSKVQFSCKMNFKNSVDVEILLEADGLDILDINKLIGAGIKRVGFLDLNYFLALESQLLPCKKVYLGIINGQNINDILEKFDFLQNVVSLKQAKDLSLANAVKGKVKEFSLSINLVNKEESYGLIPEKFDDNVWEMAKLTGLRLRGVSVFCPPYGNVDLEKKLLRKAGVLYKILNSRYKGIELYSANLVGRVEDMISEGVNEIRIGLKTLD